MSTKKGNKISTKNSVGYVLIGSGVAVSLYLLGSSYVFPLKGLWLVLGIFTVAAGCFFILIDKLDNNAADNAPVSNFQNRSRIKKQGEKIKVSVDNCEIKSRNYTREVIKDSFPKRSEMIDSIFDNNHNYREENFQQTYFIFYRKINGTTYKFVSPASTQSKITVEEYLINQRGITLYVDSQNPNNYFFELPNWPQ